MSGSKQPTRYVSKTFETVSAFPTKLSEPNNNNNTTDLDDDDDDDNGDVVGNRNLPLRVSLFECPPAFVRDFAALFPDVACFREKRSFCLLLFSFATANDMSGWNQDVEEERARLHRVFLKIADDVVSRLVDGVSDNGADVTGSTSWADFVDPIGGKPFRGSYCNDNLFETDPRLRPFGVRIEDLGCCKCVRLEEFGSKAFVGCLFTDAAFDAPIWTELLS